jgi:hypothetical protein
MGNVREDIEKLRGGVPGWLVFALVAVLASSAALGVITQRFDAWVTLWFGLAQVGVSIFVVYLFYRFVLAVERIADGL